jgi:hypothetical protein
MRDRGLVVRFPRNEADVGAHCFGGAMGDHETGSVKWAVSKASESLADFPANIHSCGCSPPIRKGAPGPISGPETNPSSETLNSNRTLLIALLSSALLAGADSGHQYG